VSFRWSGWLTSAPRKAVDFSGCDSRPGTGSLREAYTLGLTNWFTPYNHPYLSEDDLDLANGVVILPD